MTNIETFILFMSAGLTLLIYLILQINILKLESKLEKLENYVHKNDPKYINTELSKLDFEIYALTRKRETLKKQLEKTATEQEYK